MGVWQRLTKPARSGKRKDGRNGAKHANAERSNQKACENSWGQVNYLKFALAKKCSKDQFS